MKMDSLKREYKKKKFAREKLERESEGAVDDHDDWIHWEVSSEQFAMKNRTLNTIHSGFFFFLDYE